PLYIAVKNHSPFARAKNVTITAVQAAIGGTQLVYDGPLPFVVPDGAALLAGRSAIFEPHFLNPPAGTVTFLSVTVKADNLAPFTTVLLNDPSVVKTQTRSQ